MKNADFPAMPLSGDAYQDFAGYDGTKNTGYNPECQGLTKREMFAMHAMQAMLSSRHVSDFNGSDADFNNGLCSKAVGYADALLEELSK